MLRNKKIAVVFTASIVGGHELMAMQQIKKYGRKGFSISSYIPQGNGMLIDLFKKNGLAFDVHKVAHQKVEVLHSFFNPIYIKKSIYLLNTIKEKFDEVIIIQGDIELGAGFINAAKLIGVSVISYIPYAHEFTTMGSRGGAVKDLLANLLYKNCSRYITISNCFKKDIILKNKYAQVKVIKNFVPSPPVDQIRNKNALFGKKTRVLRILMAGRVFFRQKGQDNLLKALRDIKDNIEVKVIGDGPDLEKMKTLAATLPRHIKVSFLGWQNDVWSHADDIDVILIPSNFEGVPLIMLEAIKRNVPVIAAKRDGMVDYLDEKSLYEVINVSREQKVKNLHAKIKEFLLSFH